MSDALIGQLRNRWDQNVPLLCDKAADRIEELEAALREIHEAHRDSLDGDKVTAEIARRALEGKP